MIAGWEQQVDEWKKRVELIDTTNAVKFEAPSTEK